MIRRMGRLGLSVGLTLAGAILVHACGDGATGPGPAPTGRPSVPDPAPALAGAGLVAAAPAKVCGEETVVDLVGNKGFRVGTVTVSNDEDEVTVLYEVRGDWELMATHLAVATSLADIPVAPSGLPEIGTFPYGADHDPGTTTFGVTLSMDGLGARAGDELVVAAHADVIDRNDPADPDDDEAEGVWGEGTAFSPRPRGNVGAHFGHEVQGCTEVAQTIGVEGGTLEVAGGSADEGVTLVIPPGALQEPVEITVEAIPLSEVAVPGSTSLGAGGLIEGTTYDFGPDGLVFLEAVLLTIGYDESRIGSIPESAISIFRIDGGVERIEGSTVDEVRDEVSASIRHFTIYGAGDGSGAVASSVAEAVGVDDAVSIVVRSPPRPDVAEAIGVTDEVTVDVLSAIRPDVAEAIGVSDDVVVSVFSPARPDVAEAVGVTDQVTIDVVSPIRPDVGEAIGVSDDVVVSVFSPIRSDVPETIGVSDEVTITVEPAAPGNFAYVALQGADSVAVVDRDTNTLLTRIPVGRFPFAVAVRPGGSEVYVTNRGDGSVSVIDVTTQSVVATIANVVNDPVDLAFSPDGGTAYVVDNDASLVGVIDATTRTRATPLQGSTRLARAIAVTETGATGYVAGVDSLVAFDLSTGTPVDTVPGTFSTGDLALTPDDSELWLTDGVDDEVLVFDLAAAVLTGTVPGIPAPQGIAIGATGPTAYVADGGSAVTPIDVATRTVGAAIGLAFEPDWLAVSPDGTRAYVSEGRQGTRLAVVDLTSGSVVATLAVGSSPAEVGVAR